MSLEKSVLAVIRSARPTFKNDADKAVFAVHASFLASGYVLTAAGPPAFADSAFYSSSSEEVGIEKWNESENEYAFVYVNPEKNGKKALFKCLVFNDKLFVDALTDGLSEPLHLEINIGEFVGESGSTNIADQYKNLDKLVNTIEKEVLTKLDGSASSPPKSTSSLISQSRPESGDASRVVRTEPTSRAGPQINPSGVVIPPVGSMPSSDLFPGPGAGVYPTRPLFPGDGSMLMGPNDPRFGRDPNFLGRDPMFPQPGAPPGARFDPFGPPGVPGFEPQRFMRGPQRPGGMHPDLEHFGSGSDYI